MDRQVFGSARAVVAHRGARAHAPENTIPAFDAAVRAGADAIELDVHITADGHVVVCHDATVDRTTNGRGALAAMTWSHVRGLDAGARWTPHANPERANGRASGPTPFAAKGVTVPRLADVLDAFRDTLLIIEAKTIATGFALVDLIAPRGVRDRVIAGSFMTQALSPLRARGIRTSASRRECLALVPGAVANRPAGRTPFEMVAVPPRYYGLPVPVGRLARTAQVPVAVWTVNDRVQATRLWTAGAAAIITDDPAALKPHSPPHA